MNLTKLPITPELAALAAGDKPQVFTPPSPPPEPESQRLVDVEKDPYPPGHPTVVVPQHRPLPGGDTGRLREVRKWAKDLGW